jgi:hypothetical protein
MNVRLVSEINVNSIEASNQRVALFPRALALVPRLLTMSLLIPARPRSHDCKRPWLTMDPWSLQFKSLETFKIIDRVRLFFLCLKYQSVTIGNVLIKIHLLIVK